MKDKGRKAKKQYAAPEQLYDLDGTHFVHTIHGRAAVKGYAGTPGAATFNLGDNAKADEVIELGDDSDDMSALSTMTKEDLITLL